VGHPMGKPIKASSSSGPWVADAPMLSVFATTTPKAVAFLGTLLNRGRSGVEAFSADDQSLGIFPTADDAIAALSTSRPQGGGAA
jgi:hypothetical protein